MHPTTPNPLDDSEELMSQYLAEAGDPNVEPRREHVVKLRSLLLRRLDQDLVPAPPSGTRRWATRLLVGTALAALVVVVALWSSGPRGIAWAQVAKALQERPWVHGTIVDAQGNTLVEQWFKLNREKGGERAGNVVAFHDYKRLVHKKYVAGENAIYLLPESLEGRPDATNFLRQLLDVLRDPKGPSKFPFPGMELIGQTQRTVTQVGVEQREVELTFRIAGGQQGETVAMQIRVDPTTNLPGSLVLIAEDGKRYTAAIDYPDDGPADIYDLGVPRSAKVIDRMVSEEVRQVLAGLKSGRRDFDDYCALVVEDRIRPNNYLPMTTVQRVWKKGPKWRIEQLRPETLEWAPPPEAETKWWKEHQKDFEFIPRLICDGTVYWNYYLADSWKAGDPVPQPGKPNGSGQTVGPNQFSGPADDPVIPFWCQQVLPEQVGHPTAGVDQPDNDREFIVEGDAKGGPPGTILLRGRDTNARDERYPDFFRLWIDPKANHLVMQAEVRVHEPRDISKVAWIGIQTLDGVVKSPAGYPYPTSSHNIQGESEIIRRFFLDFEARISDDLFEPLK
jgi:hypothetical protein